MQKAISQKVLIQMSVNLRNGKQNTLCMQEMTTKDVFAKVGDMVKQIVHKVLQFKLLTGTMVIVDMIIMAMEASMEVTLIMKQLIHMKAHLQPQH